MLRALLPVIGALGDFDAADAGEAGEDFFAPLEVEEEVRAGVEADGRGFLIGHAEIFAQCADGGDELLQQAHFAHGGAVAGEVGGLRVAGERDGFVREARRRRARARSPR